MSDKISYSIPEFCEASGLCRSNVYEAIRGGRLTARKHGRRTIIAVDEAKAFIAALPQVQSVPQQFAA